MNFIERMVLKKIMIAKIKQFISQYPNEAHFLALLITGLATAFKTNDAFHALVLKYFAHMPGDAQTLLMVLVPILLLYFGTKDDGSGPPPNDGPASSLPQSKPSSKGNSMKRSLMLAVALICLSVAAFSQDAQPATSTPPA
jgi:hypothetical protein